MHISSNHAFLMSEVNLTYYKYNCLDLIVSCLLHSLMSKSRDRSGHTAHVPGGRGNKDGQENGA